MAIYNNIGVVNVEDTNVVLVSCNYKNGTYTYPDLSTIVEGIKDGKMIICALYNNDFYYDTLIMTHYGFITGTDTLVNISFDTNPMSWYYDGNAVYLGNNISYTVRNNVGTWTVNWDTDKTLLAYTSPIKQISVQGTYAVSGTTLSITYPFLWRRAGEHLYFSGDTALKILWDSLSISGWNTGAGNFTLVLQSPAQTDYCYARATNFVYNGTTKTLIFETAKVDGVAFDIELQLTKSGSTYSYTFTSTAV